VRRFVDISVPRNIAPQLNELEGQAIVYNVDDLKEVRWIFSWIFQVSAVTWVERGGGQGQAMECVSWAVPARLLQPYTSLHPRISRPHCPLTIATASTRTTDAGGGCQQGGACAGGGRGRGSAQGGAACL